jgi:hypothetical protein
MICSVARDDTINIYLARAQWLRRPIRLDVILDRVSIGYVFIGIVTELEAYRI